MSLENILGGPNWREVYKQQEPTEIHFVIANWHAPPWDLDEITQIRYYREQYSRVRKLVYSPEGKLLSVEYAEPQFYRMSKETKPWVLLGSYLGDGLFKWEYRTINSKVA